MDEIVADYPKARLKVILDNLNTHKKNDEWLKRHPLVTGEIAAAARSGCARSRGLNLGRRRSNKAASVGIQPTGVALATVQQECIHSFEKGLSSKPSEPNRPKTNDAHHDGRHRIYASKIRVYDL
jgi:hypothetical protein